MTTAEIILSVCAIATLLVSSAAWLIGIGRIRQRIDTIEDDVGKLTKDLDERATVAALAALTTKTDGLEKDVKEVAEIKQQLKAHADLTTEKLGAMSQQMRDGFALVASEQRSFDRLVVSQLEEVKHRLREPGAASAN